MKELAILKELSVLYVDDDLKACESLEHILKYYFKDVYIAHNGEEAFKLYKGKKCHLLIVDYDMPIMDGYEFLSQVRRSDNTTPAVILSSYDDKSKLKNAIKLNLLEYLVKPYELDQLKNVLQEFVKQIEKEGLLKYTISNNCYYDYTKKEIVEKETIYKLTSFEVKIFEFLLNNRYKVTTYEELLYILNTDNQKSLISMIYKINKKLPRKLIENIKDIGYKLNI